MSTINNAVFHDDGSDSENDPDFVPNDDSHSDEECNTIVKSNDQRPQVADEARVAAATEARASLWASFQDSVESKTNSEKSNHPSRKLVKIEKRFRFAGEEIVEVIEVPEDSEDAKKWPLWKPPASTSQASSSPETRVETLTECSPSSSTPTSSSSTPRPDSRPTRPGPRKPKTSLIAPLQKAKKISTLEKSAMDWKKHVATESDAGTGLKDELEANRRGGGYIERVEFLERVGERREEIYDRERASKRRRG